VPTDRGPVRLAGLVILPGALGEGVRQSP
jgi:hypothetical protein